MSGGVWRGKARFGEVWQGSIGRVNRSLGALTGLGRSRQGLARRGVAWLGAVRFGMVSIGKANRFAGVFGAWFGLAWQG